MALEMRDLRLIAAVAEHGTLTRAGNVLFLTQSALSRQLSDLERRLGLTLFERRGRRMVPTPAGERLLESGREILEAVARAEEEARDTAARGDSVLRFSTECYTCYHWLPTVLIEFQRGFPGVEARIVAGATRRPIPALLRDQLDVAVVSTPLRDRRIVQVPLFRDEFVAVVPPGHAWASRPYVKAVDFADQHLFLYNIPRSESTLFREVLDPAGVMPRRVSRVELTEAILELVRAGFGVAMLPRWAVAPYVRSGALVAVPITETGMQRQWNAAVLAHREIPPYLEGFIDLLIRIGEPPETGAGFCTAGTAGAAEIRVAAG